MSTQINERLIGSLQTFDPVKEKDTRRVLSPDEVRYKSLLIAMANKTVSFRQAVKIVGGTVRLQNLITQGRIRCFKPAGKENLKWKINAADCYSNVRPRLKELSKQYVAS